MDPWLHAVRALARWLIRHKRMSRTFSLLTIGSVLFWGLVAFCGSWQKVSAPVVWPTAEPTLKPSAFSLEAIARGYGSVWDPYAKVLVTDGIWDCDTLTTRNRWDGDETRAILTNEQRTAWALVIFDEALTCDELHGRQVAGQPARVGYVELFNLEVKDYFAPYQNVVHTVQICTYCEPVSLRASSAIMGAQARKANRNTAIEEMLCGMGTLLMLALVTLAVVSYED